MTTDDDLRAKLKQLRLQAGLTQAALAERLRCSAKRVANVEGGHRRASFDLAAAWAAACGYMFRPTFEPATPTPPSPLERELRSLIDDPPSGRAAEALLQQLHAWANLARRPREDA